MWPNQQECPPPRSPVRALISLSQQHLCGFERCKLNVHWWSRSFQRLCLLSCDNLKCFWPHLRLLLTCGLELNTCSHMQVFLSNEGLTMIPFNLITSWTRDPARPIRSLCVYSSQQQSFPWMQRHYLGWGSTLCELYLLTDSSSPATPGSADWLSIRGQSLYFYNFEIQLDASLLFFVFVTFIIDQSWWHHWFVISSE